MAWCAWCETELPSRDDGRETRRYCSQVCRQNAYMARRTPAQLAHIRARAAATRNR